jgi:hypothetical protein
MNPPIVSKNENGQIGLGVYVAYQWRHPAEGGREIVRMWIGTEAGPMLAWDADGAAKWDGEQTKDFAIGAWTPLYSRGDFGRNYACGGHWSSHCGHMLGTKAKPNKVTRCVVLPGDAPLFAVPQGIEEDVTVHDLSCEGGWAIWFATAGEAMRARIYGHAAQGLQLPAKTKINLARETDEMREAVWDVLRAYSLT